MSGCGVTLITDSYALTSASCLDISTNDVRRLAVKIRLATNQEELIDVHKTYQHPAYTVGSHHHNIGIVELGRRVEFNMEKY